MFNTKLKERIKELEKELESTITQSLILQFREGDKVYVQDGKRNPTTPYYLIKSYNNGFCYHISDNPETPKDSSFSAIYDSIDVTKISHDMPKSCNCCGNLLEQKTYQAK